MEQKSRDIDYEEIADYEKRAVQERHHRGRSSEGLLDKEIILAALEIKPGQTILDAGCGNGYMSKEFSKLVGGTGKVYALDPDEIGIATLRTETAGTNIVAVVGDITTTNDLPASAFDLIYLSTVIHGFSPEQFKRFEAEVKRLLSHYGRLAIVEIVKQETPFDPPMDRRISPEELKTALGFTAKETVTVGEYFYMQLFENRPAL